jgi:hypothetical protein
MNIPEYVTVDEVKRVCAALGIRDWTQLTSSQVDLEEARIIYDALEVKDMQIALDDFRAGLEVELEHGTMYSDVNVTNNHPLLTGRIVLAHFKELPDYYKRLEVAEIEGDVIKALVASNAAKLEKLYRKLAAAKLALSEDEARRLA